METLTQKELLKLAIKKEEFNSNNAWGFGGARGVRYIFENNFKLTIAKAGTRHQGEFSFITFVNREGHSLIDKPRNKLTDIELIMITEILKQTK